MDILKGIYNSNGYENLTLSFYPYILYFDDEDNITEKEFDSYINFLMRKEGDGLGKNRHQFHWEIWSPNIRSVSLIHSYLLLKGWRSKILDEYNGEWNSSKDWTSSDGCWRIEVLTPIVMKLNNDVHSYRSFIDTIRSLSIDLNYKVELLELSEYRKYGFPMANFDNGYTFNSIKFSK